MRIAVCIKQVPAYSDGNMDEKTGLLIRTGLAAIVNPSDLAALETGLRIKEQMEAQIDVFTMGPEGAEAVIREAYARGADRGFLLSDKAFGGADVLATSYTLMQAITTQEPYDLILCGRQTTDGDTGQVGGELAGWLNIPHFFSVGSLEKVTENDAEITTRFEEKIWKGHITFPALLAVEQDIFPTRMPSLRLRMSANKKEVIKLGISDLPDSDCEHYGLKGSATRVKKIFPPPVTKRRELIHISPDKEVEMMNQIVDSIMLGKEQVL